MWNTNDFDAAYEHIEDLRRTAEKHNALARMKAAGQDGQAGQQAKNQPGKSSDKQSQNLWERVRNTLR